MENNLEKKLDKVFSRYSTYQRGKGKKIMTAPVVEMRFYNSTRSMTTGWLIVLYFTTGHLEGDTAIMRRYKKVEWFYTPDRREDAMQTFHHIQYLITHFSKKYKPFIAHNGDIIKITK